MDAIFHIGFPKTGSTTLQQFLATNARDVADQGITFPHTGWVSANHVSLLLAARVYGDLPFSQFMFRNARWLGAFEDLPRLGQRALDGVRTLAKDGKTPTALFSTEFFLPWLDTPEALAAMHNLMAECFDNVRYIAYFREPVAQVQSAYNETIKRGESIDIVAHTQANTVKINQWSDRLLHLGDLAGPGNVDLRIFDRKTLHKGDIVDDFCEAVGLDIAQGTAVSETNLSLTATGLEVLRNINAGFEKIMTGPESRVYRKGLTPQIRELTRDAPKRTIPRNAAQQLVDDTVDCCEALRKKYRPDLETLVAAPNLGPQDTSDEVDAEQVRSALSTILVDVLVSDPFKTTNSSDVARWAKSVANRQVERALGRSGRR